MGRALKACRGGSICFFTGLFFCELYLKQAPSGSDVLLTTVLGPLRYRRLTNDLLDK